MATFRITLAESPEQSSFVAVPVRPAPRVFEIFPTLIKSNEKGELVYGEDVPAQWWTGTRTFMRNDKADVRSVDFTRLEVRFQGKSSKQAAENHTLVIAEVPRSNRRVAFAKVRAGNPARRGTGGRPFEDLAEIANAAELDDKAAMAAIEGLAWDYWETGKDLVAGFSEPGRYVSPSQVQDPDERGDWMPSKTARDGAMFALGLIADPQAVRNAVFLSEAWQRLERQLEKGWFAPPIADKGLPRQIPLHDKVAGNLLQHLEVAANQAMAGPMRDDDDWTGKSVVGVTLAHFMSHVYDANRRAANAAPDERVIEVPFEDWDGHFVRDGRKRIPKSEG